VTPQDALERCAYLLLGILIVLLIDAARSCESAFLWC